MVGVLLGGVEEEAGVGVVVVVVVVSRDPGDAWRGQRSRGELVSCYGGDKCNVGKFEQVLIQVYIKKRKKNYK